MSDHDPRLSPEQDAAVRRLLADARATEPMPRDVADRLDGVLSELGRGGTAAPAPTASLEARRRRRRASTLVVAAAAVVVAGVGVGQVVRDGDTATGQADSAGPATLADRDEETAARESADATGEEEAAEDGDLKLESPDDVTGRSAMAPPRRATVARLTKDRFAADVRAVRRAISRPLAPGFAELDAALLPHRNLSPRRGISCSAAAWGPGVLVPVVFDRQPAVLAFRPATRDSQVVHVLQCGSGEPLHSSTLPRPRGD